VLLLLLLQVLFDVVCAAAVDGVVWCCVCFVLCWLLCCCCCVVMLLCVVLLLLCVLLLLLMLLIVVDAEHLVAAVIYIAQHVHVPEGGAPDVQMALSRKTRDISVLVVAHGSGQVARTVIDPKVVVPDVVPCPDEPVEPIKIIAIVA